MPKQCFPKQRGNEKNKVQIQLRCTFLGAHIQKHWLGQSRADVQMFNPKQKSLILRAQGQGNGGAVVSRRDDLSTLPLHVGSHCGFQHSWHNWLAQQELMPKVLRESLDQQRVALYRLFTSDKQKSHQYITSA